MQLKDVSQTVYSGQILSRVIIKEEVNDEVLDERMVLVPKAMVNGMILKEELTREKFKKAVDAERITQIGDIIIKLSPPYDIVYIEKGDVGLVVPSFCAIIRGLDESKINTLFFAAYLNTEYAREILKSKVYRSHVPLITIKDIGELEIPNVELEKQKKIGEIYLLSCSKQEILREMLENEKKLVSNIVLQAIEGVVW